MDIDQRRRLAQDQVEYGKRVERVLGINQHEYPHGKHSPCCGVDIDSESAVLEDHDGRKHVTKYFCTKCCMVLKTKIKRM